MANREPFPPINKGFIARDKELAELPGGGGDVSDISDLTATGYTTGKSPRWNGSVFVSADYYTEAEANALLANKSDAGHAHTFASLTSKPTTLAGYGIVDAAALVHAHDDLYYTEAEIDALIADFLDQAAADLLYAPISHNHNALYYTEAEADALLAGKSSTAHTHALDGLSDVNAPTPANGDVLTWDSTPGEWVAQAPTGGGASDIGDLTATGYSTGNYPRWNGTDFVGSDVYTEAEADARYLGLAGGTMTGAIAIPNGLVGAPSIFFTNSTTTGIYRSAADTLAIGAAGALIATFGAGTLTVNNAFTVLGDSGGTNTIRNVVYLGATTSSAAAAGYGIGVVFRQKSSTTTQTEIGRLSFPWNDATHASRKPDAIFALIDSAAERTVWHARANGSAALIGFLGATPAARQTGGAATATGTWTATEQAMLQAAYDALRTFGFLT